MRLIIFLLLFCCFSKGYSQWEKIYPISSRFIDISVPDPGYVFLLTEKEQKIILLKSTDEASTWKELTPGEEYENLNAVHFSDSLLGYVASNRSIHKTTDGGLSWALIELQEDLTNPYDIVFTSRSTGYIRFNDNKMIKTVDGGDSWEVLSNAPVSSGYSNSFSFANDQIGYAISGYYLFKTTDGGSTWEQLTDAPYSGKSIFAVNENIAFFSSNFETYKTSDGGKSWEQINWNSAKEIYFKDSVSGVLFSDYGEVFITSDGLTFERTYDSKFTISWHKADFAQDFGCAIGGDNAIVVTADGGKTWRLKNIIPQHGQLRDIHFLDAKNGFIIGENRGFIRTDDNCKSWYYDERDFRDDLYQMSFSDPDTGIFIVTNNYAYTSYDGGETLTQTDWTVPIIGHLQTSNYEMLSSKIIYAVGRKEKIVKSIDGGRSWEAYKFDFSNPITDIECINEDTCHAVGFVGIVLSTWNGGKNWKIHDLKTNSDLSVIHLLNSSLGFAGGARGTLLRTTNAGNTWEITKLTTWGKAVSFNFISDTKGFATFSNGDIFRTNDAGLTWKFANSQLAFGYESLQKSFMRDSTHIYGFTEQCIYKWTPPSYQEENPEEPGEEIITGIDEPVGTGIIAYPNPTTGNIYLKTKDEIEEIFIFDIMGKPQKFKRSNDNEIDIEQLTAGIYLVNIKTTSSFNSIKITKR